jgi:uncharacterized protein (UPF0210 family)
MKIRSITCFYNPCHKDNIHQLETLTECIKAGKQLFEAAGYPVQTTRLATIPFPIFKFPKKDFVDQIKNLENTVIEHGFDYLSLGPALPEKKDSYDLVPKIMSATDHVFCSGSMTTRKGEISLPAVFACAKIIEQIAAVTPDGFKNLNFSAIANVKPYGPFFPSGYAGNSQPAFALAIEGADLAVQAFSAAKSLSSAKKVLIKNLEEHARKLTSIANELSHLHHAKFQGIDFSLAPFPQDEISAGYSLELLGVSSLGSAGSLAAAAFLASILDEGKWKKAGFNGLMLPVLEDSVLAKRSIEGSLTIKDLMMFSAVCGTGLDTIALPGDIKADQIAGILMDIAFLAVRLNKPLTARLMPVPGKKVGDITDFHFEYFANGKIMDPLAQPLGFLFKSSDKVKIKTRF